MKFDIARAWKDEAYRQTLSEEQLEMLPANPAGDLNEAELASVCGGTGPFGVGLGTASAASAVASSQRFHSLALLCDVSLFSINLIQILVVPIASPTTQVCAEEH